MGCFKFSCFCMVAPWATWVLWGLVMSSEVLKATWLESSSFQLILDWLLNFWLWWRGWLRCPFCVPKYATGSGFYSSYLYIFQKQRRLWKPDAWINRIIDLLRSVGCSFFLRPRLANEATHQLENERPLASEP